MSDWEITESTPHCSENGVYWTHKTWTVKGESFWSKAWKIIKYTI